MAERLRKHPDLVVVKASESIGFGFTYLSETDFNASADQFLLPALKYSGDEPDTAERRRTVAYDFLWRFFNKPTAPQFFRDNVRWISAAAVREKFSPQGGGGPMPRVIAITRKASDGGIAISSAEADYLEHPGYPLALIIGKPAYGGGPAHFFTSREAYEKVGQSKPSQDVWLPQIVFRLYAETPSVVMGMPKQGKEGEMAVECRALAFGRKAKLVERQ